MTAEQFKQLVDAIAKDSALDWFTAVGTWVTALALIAATVPPVWLAHRRERQRDVTRAVTEWGIGAFELIENQVVLYQHLIGRRLPDGEFEKVHAPAIAKFNASTLRALAEPLHWQLAERIRALSVMLAEKPPIFLDERSTQADAKVFGDWMRGELVRLPKFYTLIDHVVSDLPQYLKLRPKPLTPRDDEVAPTSEPAPS